MTREIQARECRNTGGIARYLWRERCALCGTRSARDSICTSCAVTTKAQKSAAALTCRLGVAYGNLQYCNSVSKSFFYITTE